MTRIGREIDVSGEFSGGASSLIIFGLLIVGLFVGQLIGTIVSALLAFSNGLELAELIDNPAVVYDYLSLTQVLFGQALYTVIFTFLTPWFYLKFFTKKSFSDLSIKGPVNPILVLIVILTTFSFMLVNAYVIEWNMNVKLPDFLSEFEEWAQELERKLAEATEKFTNFRNFTEFLVGFIVISVLAGIGEEFLFRGVLQNGLQKWTKNIHVAIWVSAFLFSAIHMQFYGLVPRMFLGAIFGYLYVWSGNLWYPIVAHMANNGIAVIIAYTTSTNFDETENVPVYFSIIGLLTFVGLMAFFKKSTLNESSFK